MKHYTKSDVDELAVIYALVNNGEPYSCSTIATIGGVKRRARQRAIVEFCTNMQFEDISLHGMRHVMKKLFGVSVSNNHLVKWATPGRKADNRVNLDLLLGNISQDCKRAAAALLIELDEEWPQLKQLALAEAAKLRSPSQIEA